MKVSHMHREQSVPRDKPHCSRAAFTHEAQADATEEPSFVLKEQKSIGCLGPFFSLLFAYQIGWQEASLD